MKADHLFELLGDMDNDYIAEAAEYPRQFIHRKRFGFGIAAAACLILAAAGVGIWMQAPVNHEIRLSDASKLEVQHDTARKNVNHEIRLSDASKGVTVQYVESPADETNNYFISGDMVMLSADEIFHGYDTVIFRGTVAKIQEIEIGFFMQKEYAAIVDFIVDEVYRGDLQSGETISVFIDSYNWIYCGCTEIMDDMQVGMEGIFMPQILDETDVMVRNHATLLKKDLADYELSDQFLFLQGEEGLLCSGYDFRRDAGDTLDEAEVYVRSMLAKK